MTTEYVQIQGEFKQADREWQAARKAARSAGFAMVNRADDSQYTYARWVDLTQQMSLAANRRGQTWRRLMNAMPMRDAAIAAEAASAVQH